MARRENNRKEIENWLVSVPGFKDVEVQARTHIKAVSEARRKLGLADTMRVTDLVGRTRVRRLSNRKYGLFR